jgi:hypothetical protein
VLMMSGTGLFLIMRPHRSGDHTISEFIEQASDSSPDAVSHWTAVERLGRSWRLVQRRTKCRLLEREQAGCIHSSRRPDDGAPGVQRRVLVFS